MASLEVLVIAGVSLTDHTVKVHGVSVNDGGIVEVSDDPTQFVQYTLCGPPGAKLRVAISRSGNTVFIEEAAIPDGAETYDSGFRYFKI